MPSTSKAQYQLMRRAAKDKDFAKERDVKQKMAREWVYKDMAKVLTDHDHGELIGVSKKEATAYINSHAKPSGESRPSSLEW